MLEKLCLAAAITISANFFLGIQSPDTSAVGQSLHPETENQIQNQLVPTQPVQFPPLAIRPFHQSK